MSREDKNARLAVERDFSTIRMQYFLCPDGNPRQLQHFEVKNDHLYLSMQAVRPEDEPTEYSWPVDEVATQWARFNRISQQQAIGSTSLKSTSNPALPRLEQHEQSQQSQPSLTPEVLPASSLPAKLEQVKQQTEQLLPMKRISDGLETLFDRIVENTKPGNRISRELLESAKVADGLAARAIDMRKLQLEAMKFQMDQTRSHERPTV